MNKKGQSLIMLIIIMPIILILIAGIIDLGNIEISKNKIVSISETLLRSGLEEKEINDIINIYKDNDIEGNLIDYDNNNIKYELDIQGLLKNYKIVCNIIMYEKDGKMLFKKGN